MVNYVMNLNYFLVEKPVTTVAPTQAVKSTQSTKDEPEAFSLEIFLLYLKNDIKFLKEEITDVKFRLRSKLYNFLIRTKFPT